MGSVDDEKPDYDWLLDRSAVAAHPDLEESRICIRAGVVRGRFLVAGYVLPQIAVRRIPANRSSPAGRADFVDVRDRIA